MEKKIFSLVDKDGNSKDKNGNAYGFFMGNEEELCKSYCKANGLDYVKKTIRI